MPASRHGLLLGFAAYAIWGFFPLYWRLLDDATPLEILAHRIVWSVVFVAILLAARRRWQAVRDLTRQPRKLAGVALAAVLIGVNWLTFIYGVSSEQVVEVSLGYFVTPLVAVGLGVVALKERLRATQWVAVGISTLAVVVLTVDYGRLPWIALLLAVSFGLYGLVKKRLALPAAEGLLVESSVLAPVALVYLAVQDGQAFGHGNWTLTALLVVAGPVTAIPLLLFAGAANRIPLTILGVLQYLAPILHLAIGVLAFHEPMPAARLAGFALVWLALAVFSWDGIRATRRSRLATAAA
ncbi:protein RarD [Virgisporangium aliadipatigenens]|uniref:Protein RarD n=1 Tax=Virgisporangium aliadipatigenens TaxID=741659 RepID=A0A8J3YL19_9ACTN|nr:EamA family transporter RarD [Virgisporangium aliadipatigenens]GIJ47359.1 protein RarD [Virgisporangium aliadipatigenens]